MDKPPPKPTATVRFRRVPTADGRMKFVRVGGPWPPPRTEARKDDGKEPPRPKPKKKVEASKPAPTLSGVWVVVVFVLGGGERRG